VEIKINIDEEYISKLVTDILAEKIVKEHAYGSRELLKGVRDGTDKAVKQYIYKEKDKIIERVVERATVEIVKKGLPKLLENLGKEI